MSTFSPILSPSATEMRARIENYCSLCLYFSPDPKGHCQHLPPRTVPSRPPPASDQTAKDADSRKLPDNVQAIKARIIAIQPKPRPQLRHKQPAKQSSLRKLRQEQLAQSIVRAKRSEEQLQEAYDAQILEYLQDPPPNHASA